MSRSGRAALVAGCVIAIAGCKHGGVGYGYEHHRVTASATVQDRVTGEDATATATASYGRHRIKVIDVSGIAFALIGGAASVRLVDPSCPPGSSGCTARPIVDLGNGRYEYSVTARMVPIIPGIRFTAEYAWADGTTEVEAFNPSRADAMSSGPGSVEYTEYRATLGLQERRGRLYFDLTVLDFASKDLRIGDVTGSTLSASPFQWRIGGEVGAIVAPMLRAGVYLDVDMVSGVDALFEGSRLGYDAGLAAALVTYPIVLEGRLEREVLAGDGHAAGTGFIVSGALVY